MLVSYLRERFPAWLFLPLAAALCGIAFAEGAWPQVWRRVAAGLFALLLLLQFRLWDDLADLLGDRKSHPQRVLPRASSLGQFRVASWILCGVCLVLAAALDASGRKVAALAGLDLVFFLWYRLRSVESTLGFHLVLLKYPVFLYLLTAGFAPPLLAMTLVYLAACVYEVLHDARLRRVLAARVVCAIEAVLLSGIGAAAIFLGGKS